MPNTFSYVVIISWPVVTFICLNKFGVGRGSLIALLSAYMFLPASFSLDIPGFPDLNKFLMTTLTILSYLIISGRRLGIVHLDKYLKLLFWIFMITPFCTALTNKGWYLHLPGLSLYDGLSNSVVNFLNFLPFFIGLRYFREEKEQIVLFKYFAFAAFVYSFLALYEIRMSPQLHNIVYGYFPHSWVQQYRSGGFRAVVFMGHGLLVAMFLALGVGFWAAMNKAKQSVFSWSNTLGLFVVFFTLLLSKSMAALLYGVFALLSIKFFKPKQIYLVSFMMAVLFMTYPILSATGLFPHKNLVQIAESISYERAQSLNFRFENENILLSHANERPWFGWGGWGRNRVFDHETGQDVSITDGEWIITLGKSGWFGFLSTFLFMFIPIWLVFKKNKKILFTEEKSEILLASHCLIVALIMVDQLPNASLNPLYWLIAGSLLGRVQVLPSEKSNSKAFSDDSRLIR